MRAVALAALAAFARCAAGIDDPGVAVALSVNNLACDHFGAAEQGVLFTAVAAMLAPDAAKPVLAKIQGALGPTSCEPGQARASASASIELRGAAVGLLAVGVALFLFRRR